MSNKRVYFGFALPISLALACAACGQGNQEQPVENQPAPTATAATNPSAMSPNPTNGGPMSAPATTAGMPAGANSGFAAFGTLAGSKGYITQSDAMQDHWLNNHFAECDSDHDGKVTHTEYDACRPQTGSMAQPQPEPQTSGL